MPLTRDSRIALLALIALSLLLRMLWLDRGALAHDEPFTVYWSQRPMADFWAMLGTENNPPLHFLLTRWWSSLVPFEPAWLRLPSVLASALVVWPLFLLAHRLSNLPVAITAGLLLAFSNYQFGFAQEVRAYALFTLLAAWSMWLLARIASADGRSSALPLAFVNVLLVYTHFFGWLLIGVQAIAVLMHPHFKVARMAFLRALLLTSALFSPYLLVFLTRTSSAISEGTWLGPPAWEELYNMVWRWSNAPVLAIGLPLIIAAAFLRKRSGAPLRDLALLWCLLPLVGMFTISFWVPVFHGRYLAYAAPAYALLVATSIELLPIERKLRLAVSVIVTAGMAFTFAPNDQKRYEPEQVAKQVDEWCDNECLVQVGPAWYWLNYLAAKDIVELQQDQEHLLRSGVFMPSEAQAATMGPVVLVDASGDERLARTRAALRAAFGQVDSIQADHRVWVLRYTRPETTVRP